ncbi:MAG TPA: arylamine N-acetyltransferase [Pyrinomonadaceae bacterium]|nr:arylamine N-acetyltransferase [Pyrinomonadaceae bacterium]
MSTVVSAINTREYLARIGADNIGSVADTNTLRMLQRQHLLNVPFENLDIHWGRPITIDTDKFYQKIVHENRGGFCYELNGLFNELLRDIGFQTRLVSARVGDGKGNYSDEYDHLAILVIIGEMHHLADVGFGSFTSWPLQFIPDLEQEDETGVFAIRPYRDDYFEVAKKEEDEWRSEYIFRPFGRDLSEFEARCEYQQTSPESHFTKNKICSLMTVSGRKTLTDTKFIVTKDGEKTETAISSDEEFYRFLLNEFGINRRSPMQTLL